MYIKKLKVRTGKARFETICAPHLARMLGCWAAKGDLHNMGECREAAAALQTCMVTLGSGKKGPQSTINYHLAQLQKVLK